MLLKVLLEEAFQQAWPLLLRVLRKNNVCPAEQSRVPPHEPFVPPDREETGRVVAGLFS